MQKQNRAAALITTLAILALLTALVLALFLAVTNERTESAAEGNLGDAQRLAETVVNLVKSTVAQGTTGFETAADGTATTKRVAWASQPGLIRTWRTDGSPEKSFHLFSCEKIVTDGAPDLAADYAALAAWKTGDASFNALWCDLNAPGLSSTGARIYPILAPPADTRSGSQRIDADAGVPTDDPSTGTAEGVQGYSVSEAPGYSGSSPSSTNNPLPMPVRWLYILRDGRFVSPQGNGTSASINGASASNPIIGRVAYWTDDETCKVNINTASEGVFWQYPRTLGGKFPAETTPAFNALALSQFQPARNEFQRYPGHPAKTSLSAVFGELTPEQILALTPRVQNGGSLGGTRSPYNRAINLVDDRDRLYASTDELLYRADRTANGGLTAEMVGRRSGFLTASSRSPETTLFDTPRVSLWPATLPLATKQDGFDRLLARCATLRSGGTDTLFYFQRQDARNPTSDWSNITRNQQLYAYLQRLTGETLPGFGGDFLSKFGADRDQILTQIFDYIRSGPNLMGAGHSLTVPNTFFQRSYASFNGFFNTSLVVPIQIGATRGFGNSWFLQQAGVGFFCEGMELVPPSGGPGSKIRYTVRAVPLVQLYRPSWMWDATSIGPDNTLSNAANAQGIWLRITSQSFANLAPGPAGTLVSGGAIDFPVNDPLLLNRQRDRSVIMGPASTFATKFAPEGTQKQVTASGKVFAAATQTTLEFPTPINPATGQPFTVDPASWESTPAPGRPSVTARFNTANDPNLRMNFSGLTMTIDMLSFDKTTVLHSATVTIPGGTYAIPHWDFNRTTPTAAGSAVTSQTKFAAVRTDFRDRAIGGYPPGSGYDYKAAVGVDGDVVLGMEITASSNFRGDARLAAIRGLTAADFELSAASTAQPLKHAHAFDVNGDSNMAKLTNGVLVKDVPGPSQYTTRLGASGEIPALSSGMNGAFKADGSPGDWDNGYGLSPDGAYINAADTGGIGQELGATTIGSNSLPYFTTLASGNNLLNTAQFASVYSPNRQMYSAFQFGSLPARAKAGDPWETLLFCPNPAAGRTNHRGYTQSPRDHLLADLFWMPVVDPYPISDPFATAGKVNLNHQMAPFTHIRRATGLWAALKATRITAIDGNLLGGSPAYKQKGLTPPTVDTQNVSYVRDIDIKETLDATDQKFDTGEIFKSPTEIAEMFLVPNGTSLAGAPNWWNTQVFTGDNTREAPYADLLPRLTTRSNTFTVHYRVQRLKKAGAAATPSEWNEGRDVIESEIRGSATIERYIDPADTSIPDFAQPANAGQNLARHYRWRTVSQKRFLP